MKSLRFIFMMVLLSVVIPVTQIYAMNKTFTAYGLTTKKSEEPAVADYKIHLDIEVERDTDLWKQFPNEQCTRNMAIAQWKRSRFNELSKYYVFAHAKETLENEIENKQYKKDEMYQMWIWDKTLIGGESIPCPYLEKNK
ncbi:MAG: hypothetical protein Q8Q60_04650 [Candidatus Chromulinivorax sp.]|nr:hypothetical protein [Candidatus Chromulinivorax sp.]